jgi:hypothetical protein
MWLCGLVWFKYVSGSSYLCLLGLKVCFEYYISCKLENCTTSHFSFRYFSVRDTEGLFVGTALACTGQLPLVDLCHARVTRINQCQSSIAPQLRANDQSFSLCRQSILLKVLVSSACVNIVFSLDKKAIFVAFTFLTVCDNFPTTARSFLSLANC